MREISKIFEQFLVDENCFSEFCINLIELSHTSFNEFIAENNPEDYIIFGFCWYDCKFNTINWYQIHTKWINLYDKTRT